MIPDVSCKQLKIVQPVVRDRMDNGPVDLPVGMNGYVSESDCAFEPLRKPDRKDVHVTQPVTSLGHRIRGGMIRLRNEVCRSVDAQLDGPGEIHAQNVLRIPIGLKGVHGPGPFVLNPTHTPTERLNFLFN